MTRAEQVPVPCAICGGLRTTPLYRKWEHDIARCASCSLVYATPRAAERTILARYSGEYFWHEYLPALGVVDGRYDLEAFDRRYAPMLELLSRATDGRRLVEIGTGAGFFLKAAERRGWKVAGVELSADGVAFARDRLGLDVRRERAEDMSFAPATFDAAVMLDVIEHLFEPQRALEAVRRALVPGGLLVVLTPNFNALSRHALGVDWAILSPLEHMYYFTERTLRRLLERTGFAAVRFEREYPGWGKFEAMNFRNTHRPDSWRARGYEWLVRHDKGQVTARVKRYGFADALLAVAGTANRDAA